MLFRSDSKLTVLKKLVELGCDVKTNSISFDYCVERNFLKIAKFLIDNGLDVTKLDSLGRIIKNIFNEFVYYTTEVEESSSRYIFQRMLIKQGMELFDLLLENGCNVNKKFSSYYGGEPVTPLEILINQVPEPDYD